MPDAHVVEWIREKYVDLVESLDERGRRRWAAIEAKSLGHGGIAAVAEAIGMSDRTIRNGIKELAASDSLPPGRQRRQGGGRKSRKAEQPSLVAALEKMISPTTRGRTDESIAMDLQEYAHTRFAITKARISSECNNGSSSAF